MRRVLALSTVLGLLSVAFPAHAFFWGDDDDNDEGDSETAYVVPFAYINAATGHAHATNEARLSATWSDLIEPLPAVAVANRLRGIRKVFHFEAGEKYIFVFQHPGTPDVYIEATAVAGTPSSFNLAQHSEVLCTGSGCAAQLGIENIPTKEELLSYVSPSPGEIAWENQLAGYLSGQGYSSPGFVWWGNGTISYTATGNGPLNSGWAIFPYSNGWGAIDTYGLGSYGWASGGNGLNLPASGGANCTAGCVTITAPDSETEEQYWPEGYGDGTGNDPNTCAAGCLTDPPWVDPWDPALNMQ